MASPDNFEKILKQIQDSVCISTLRNQSWVYAYYTDASNEVSANCGERDKNCKCDTSSGCFCNAGFSVSMKDGIAVCIGMLHNNMCANICIIMLLKLKSSATTNQ